MELNMPAKKTLYMEHTVVPAERTAAEISALLIRAGATRIETAYDAGKITGLKWTMKVSGMELLFAMPARVRPVYDILHKRRQRFGRSGTSSALTDMEQAERVAWRQLLRWIEAQLAMIECGMTEASEVFFPYLTHPRTGQTVYSSFAEQKFKMLEPPPQ